MIGMDSYTYTEIKVLLPGTELSILQRFGFDKDGNPLSIDGNLGPKTLGATFYVPEAASHILVSFAMVELMLGAQEYPVGRNSGKDVAKYYLKPEEIYKNHGAWCAAFSGWCLRQAYGDKAPYSWSARRLHKRSCVWEFGTWVDVARAEPGDLILWSRDKAGPANGHIGIICGEDETYVYVIEGNNGPFVRIFRYRKDRDLANDTDPCLGICRIEHPLEREN